MASGRPVVASARGGIPEVVRDGVTGLLADPKDPATFARALLTLLNNSKQANMMGQAGRAVVLNEYTPEQVYRKTLELHNLLLKQRQISIPASNSIAENGEVF
jgi:starch synthase